MKLALYQIEAEYKAITELLLDNGGEVTPEIETALAINEANLTTKGTGYGFIVKQLESEIDIISLEISRLQQLKSARGKSIDRFKETLSKAMELYQIEEIKSPIMKISFRKSESVEVEDTGLLDKKYIVTKTTESPDKTMIKEAIKRGENVQGAILKTNKNLQIK